MVKRTMLVTMINAVSLKSPILFKAKTEIIKSMFVRIIVKDAFLCENPSVSSLWCKWFLSGEKGDFFCIRRIMKTRIVSASG